MAAPLGRSVSLLKPCTLRSSYVRCSGWWQRTKDWWTKDPPEDERRMRDSDYPNMITHNSEREFYEHMKNANRNVKNSSPLDQKYYTREQGISRDLLGWLQWDYEVDDTDLMLLRMHNKRMRELKEIQKFRPDLHQTLGHELTAAHLIVGMGGAVKFFGRTAWIMKDPLGKYNLPRMKVDSLKVEAIEASNLELTSAAFQNLSTLSHLRYLNISKCKYVDDWCLSTLHSLSDSLEFLDINHCPKITDQGLASLHTLRKLEFLNASGLSGTSMVGLMTLLLEEHIPGLQVIGLTNDDVEPKGIGRGERKLVQALLGMVDVGEVMQEKDLGEFCTENTHDGFKKYPRRIDKVDW